MKITIVGSFSVEPLRNGKSEISFDNFEIEDDDCFIISKNLTMSKFIEEYGIDKVLDNIDVEYMTDKYNLIESDNIEEMKRILANSRIERTK